jgi:Tfp pilus assembly protein PilP
MKRLLLALLLPLAVAGCGEVPDASLDNFEGQEREVAEKIEDLQKAGEGRKPEDICSDILSRTVVDQLEAASTDCPAEMKKAIEDVEDYDLETRAVTVRGNQATAEVQQGEDGPTTTMEFVREGDQWRAVSLNAG